MHSSWLRPPRQRFTESTQAWGFRFPAIMRLWDSAWAEFVRFLAFDVEIRRAICPTPAIESVNTRITSLDPTDTGRKRWMLWWKPALNAFEIAFDGRLSARRN